MDPVFADIDRQTWNLAPESVKEVLKRSPNVSAIMGVHIFGNPCQVEEMEALAREYEIKLIFDAAHALGSERNGMNIGAFGDVEVFSLSPTKPVVAGEGGIISTKNEKLADILRYARDYGNKGDYNPEFIGLNARLSELHAALALGSLEMLEMNITRRNEIASRYICNLSSIPGVSFQKIEKNDRSTFKDFTILVDGASFGVSRDILAWWLGRLGIATRKYYFPPVHKVKAYWDRWGVHNDAELANTNIVSERVLSLPIWSHMETDIVDRVCEAVATAHRDAEEIGTIFDSETDRHADGGSM